MFQAKGPVAQCEGAQGWGCGEADGGSLQCLPYAGCVPALGMAIAQPAWWVLGFHLRHVRKPAHHEVRPLPGSCGPVSGRAGTPAGHSGPGAEL